LEQSRTPFGGDGEISVAVAGFQTKPYRRSNHSRSRISQSKPAADWTFKFLIKFDLLAFESNFRCIRFDLAQKRRFIANDSFKPVC
jgi:hypothetical protein